MPPLPSRGQAAESTKKLVQKLREQKKSLEAETKLCEDQLKGSYDGIPRHEVWTRAENAFNEFDYNKKYRAYIMDKTKEAAGWCATYDARIEKLHQDVSCSFYLIMLTPHPASCSFLTSVHAPMPYEIP